MASLRNFQVTYGYLGKTSYHITEATSESALRTQDLERPKRVQIGLQHIT